MNTSEALELRVLHGPQAGSTLPVEAGQAYSVGAADTCAVLLAGTQIEPEHVELSADGDGIQVTLLQGKVTTIDRGEVSSGQVIPLGTPLRIGRVKLTIDNVDAPWPHDDALEEPEQVLPAHSDSDREEITLAHEAPAPQPRIAAIKKVRSSINPAVVFGAAAVLLMGAAVAAWVTAESDQAPATQAPLAAASAPARPASVPVARVIPEAERLAIVSKFLEKHRIAGIVELNVERAPAGVLRIGGAAATQADLTAVVDAARSELADAAPVQFAVLLRSELAARFEERLRAAGIASKFKVASRDPALELRAVLTSQEVQAWESMFMTFTRDYGSVLTVRAQVQHERDLIEVQVETVVAGASPYLVTTGGRRIAPGGAIEGRTLMAIRDGELLFSDGLRVRYAN
ncbi:FHA domain-containing protein [Caenimonas koreensis]|uniref:FHA domain-containing protein n=1 Tax=Caenimonas koreensis TaxID=367474 RepID=UPI003782EA16